MFLPPAYEVRGQELFSQVFVHISGGRGGGGYLIPGPGRGTLSQGWMGGYPIPGPDGGVPWGQDGVFLAHPGLDWVPPPLARRQQHSEHLLHGGWYASCVHAGGLSCYFCI